MTTIPPLGHNNPPSDEEILHGKLTDANKELLEEGRNLLREAATLPEKIEDAEKETAVVEHIKKFQGFIKKLDAARTDAKKPHLDAGRWIDGFFKKPADAFTVAKAKLDSRVLDWKRHVAAEQEKERKAAAAAQAAEAEKQRKAAEALKEAGDDKGAAKMEKQAERAETKAERLEAAPATANTKTAAGVSSGLTKRWVGEIDNTAPVDLEALRQYLKPDHIQTAINAAVAAGVREIKGVKIHQKESVSIR